MLPVVVELDTALAVSPWWPTDGVFRLAVVLLTTGSLLLDLPTFPGLLPLLPRPPGRGVQPVMERSGDSLSVVGACMGTVTTLHTFFTLYYVW